MAIPNQQRYVCLLRNSQMAEEAMTIKGALTECTRAPVLAVSRCRSDAVRFGRSLPSSFRNLLGPLGRQGGLAGFVNLLALFEKPYLELPYLILRVARSLRIEINVRIIDIHVV